MLGVYVSLYQMEILLMTRCWVLHLEIPQWFYLVKQIHDNSGLLIGTGQPHQKLEATVLGHEFGHLYLGLLISVHPCMKPIAKTHRMGIVQHVQDCLICTTLLRRQTFLAFFLPVTSRPSMQIVSLICMRMVANRPTRFDI